MSEAMFSAFLVGQPIRDSHGITCCPAISEEDSKQYYIKNIRIPASAVQASGLLLSGAYENAAQIQEYYQSVADELCAEADMLKTLSKSGGFLPYDSWELTPAENGVGFTLSLLSPRYQGIIDRAWTYQEAINMALDLCNAMTGCRQKGYLYANLKPENIFMDEDNRYCIGDLGFLSLRSLPYSPLPEKYRSAYTAPEVEDIYATVSSNLDVYALGLILYRIFNENALPHGELTPAAHADFELWKIISTACHTDPLQRYEDPAQMGKALLDYLQTVGAENTVIGYKETESITEQQDSILFLSEEENEVMLADLLARIPDEQPPANVMNEWMTDESDDADLQMDQMLAQADELISHQLPQPVVAPEVIDVQLPQPVEDKPLLAETAEVIQPELSEQETAFTESEQPPEAEPTAPVLTDEDTPENDDEEDENEEIWDAPKKVNVKKIVIILSCVAAALALLIGGAALFNHFVYTKTVDDLVLTVKSDRVIVQIDSSIDDKLLTVVCTNSYGHTIKTGVQNGQSTVSGLNPNTTYTISLQISGFHQLSGKTSEIFVTPDNVKVSDLTVVTDVWQGSVKLNFVASGNSAWIVRCFAQGEDEKSISFEGSEISITGLTLGKEYTFTLETQDGSPILGAYQVKHRVR